MKHLRIILSTLIILAALAVPVFQSGCAGKLEPGGAYAPTNSVGVVVADKPFMIVDAAFVTAYSIIDGVFKYEEDNAAMLWALSPSIKHELDKIRPQALNARNAYFQARALYVSTKTPQSLELMKAQLSKIKKLSTDSQAVLPK